MLNGKELGVVTVDWRSQPFQERASGLFSSTQAIHKRWDYRCLAPQDDLEPEKWGTYDVRAFREANNDIGLENVKINVFNKLYNNWIDPKVLKKFTMDKKSSKKAWRRGYGYRSKRMGQGLDICTEKCEKMVSLFIAFI